MTIVSLTSLRDTVSSCFILKYGTYVCKWVRSSLQRGQVLLQVFRDIHHRSRCVRSDPQVCHPHWNCSRTLSNASSLFVLRKKFAHNKSVCSTVKTFWTLTFSNKQRLEQTGQECMDVTLTRSGWSFSGGVLQRQEGDILKCLRRILEKKLQMKAPEIFLQKDTGVRADRN